VALTSLLNGGGTRRCDCEDSIRKRTVYGAGTGDMNAEENLSTAKALKSGEAAPVTASASRSAVTGARRMPFRK